MRTFLALAFTALALALTGCVSISRTDPAGVTWTYQRPFPMGQPQLAIMESVTTTTATGASVSSVWWVDLNHTPETTSAIFNAGANAFAAGAAKVVKP